MESKIAWKRSGFDKSQNKMINYLFKPKAVKCTAGTNLIISSFVQSVSLDAWVTSRAISDLWMGNGALGTVALRVDPSSGVTVRFLERKNKALWKVAYESLVPSSWRKDEGQVCTSKVDYLPIITRHWGALIHADGDRRDGPGE